jgi:hypothetical protein
MEAASGNLPGEGTSCAGPSGGVIFVVAGGWVAGAAAVPVGLLVPADRPAFTADSASTAGSFRCGRPGSCAGSVSPGSAYRLA